MPRHFLVQRYNSLVSSTSPLSLEDDDDDDDENNQLLDLSLSSTAHSSASHRNQSKLPLSPVRFLPAEAHGKSRTLSAPIWHPAAPSPSTKRDNPLSSLPKPVITPLEFKYQSVAEGNPATLHLETGHPANTGAAMSASSNTSCSSAWLSPTNSNTPALTSPIPAVDLRWFNINASLSSHSSSRIPTLSLLPGPGGLLVSPLALFGSKLPTVFPSYHRHHHTAAPLPFLLPTTTTVAEATVNPFHLHANDTPEAETEVEADGAAAQQDDMGLDLSLKPRDIRKQQSSPIPCQNISPPITHSKRSSIKSRRIDTPSPIQTSPMPSSTSLTAEKRLRSPLPEMPGTSGKKCKSAAAASPAVLAKKHRAVRKLAFDDETTSPVSGTIIRDAADFEEGVVFHQGDIDPAFNVVEVTEEARSEIAKIENKIGDYICRLCRVIFEDAFGLAQHRCPRIVNVEYRCPECDKVFNCPANLASHRRWHKPRPNSKKSKDLSVSGNTKSSVAGALTPSNSLNNNNRKQEDRTPKSQCNPCEERKETDGEILYRLMKESALANVAAVAAAAADSRDFPVSDLNGRPAVESFGSKGYPHRCHHCLEIFVTPHHLLRHVHIYHSSELKSSTSVTTSTGSSSSMLLQIPQVRAAT